MEYSLLLMKVENLRRKWSILEYSTDLHEISCMYFVHSMCTIFVLTFLEDLKDVKRSQ